MGHNDHLDDDRPTLPPAAGRDTAKGFEPDDAWLGTAEPEQRREAMRRWFLSRYWDPAQDTPFNSAEGGYIYIHGGPYTADDELYRRFGGVCDDDEIQEAIEDIESDGITDWAPIRTEREDDFDDRFALALEKKGEPLLRLVERLRQSRQILSLKGDAETVSLARQLVFSSMIGVLETFLYETASFWIETDKSALTSLVKGLPAFREQKISLSELFDRHAGIKAHVQGHLQNLVWHRWNKVALVYKHALSLDLPDTKQFDEALLTRHDIVHRSGLTKDGAAVTVSDTQIDKLKSAIEAFARDLERRIADRDEDLSVSDDPLPREA